MYENSLLFLLVDCASDYMVSIGTEFPGDRSDCICRVISPFRTSSQNTFQGLISVCDGSVYSDPQNRIFPPVYSSSEQTDSESSSQKDSNSIPFSYAGTEAIVKYELILCCSFIIFEESVLLISFLP